MIKNDLQEMDYSELVYKYILAKMIIYKMTLDKVVVENERTRHDFLTTTFTFYSHAPNGRPHFDSVRVFDNQYKWLLDTIREEYPNIQILDYRQIKE